MVDEVTAHMARQMPWTFAVGNSWWEVTGQVNAQHKFTRCLARCVPPEFTGHDAPLFEVMVFGSPWPTTRTGPITSATSRSSTVPGRLGMPDLPLPGTDYIVTVTDREGNVIFVGSPSGQQDTFAIVQAEGKPKRLLCSVTDLSAGLTNG